MLIGLPLGLDLSMPVQEGTWLDGAGIASSSRLALFDLRSVSVKRTDSLRIG